MNSYTSLSKASAFALLAASLLFSSCEKEDDNVCGGMPTVSQVSAPTDRTSNLTTGKLAEWVIIQGSNFCNVQKVMFNDVEADLKDAYITSTEITLRVPRAIPKDVTNKVSVTTAAGSAETQYMVSIPALVITGMSNEYTPAGQRMAIVGKNFDLYGVTPTQGKLMWAGAPVTITKATADSVYFTVPAAATKGATVKVVDANGITRAVPGQYKDDRNILFGYDTGGSVWGGNDYITVGPTPAPINGSYLRVNKSINSWEWTEFSASHLTISKDIVANPSNYMLKFEVNTLKPFNANVIKFLIDGNADKVNTYQWKPSVPFDTRGKWSTMAIKLTDVINTPLAPSKAQYEVKFLFHGDGALNADIAFDNFRIVPKD